MAEVLLNHFANNEFIAYSAGSFPTGRVHPLSLKTLKTKGIDTKGYRSKFWKEFEDKNIDVVITVCDNASGEICPVFLGKAIKTHWGVADPAHFKGSDTEIEAEFKRVCETLERRIKAFCELGIQHFSKDELQSKLDEIGKL